jgi:hypothetical protein
VVTGTGNKGNVILQNVIPIKPPSLSSIYPPSKGLGQNQQLPQSF